MTRTGFMLRDDVNREVVALTKIALQITGSTCPGGCGYALLSVVWTPRTPGNFVELCGTQECHTMENNPNLDRCAVAERFLPQLL